MMEEGSFAANGVKHCIRPMDMAGKSAAFILRQMHNLVVHDAKLYDQNVDLPLQMSCLSFDEKSVPFFHQKRLESEGPPALKRKGRKPKDEKVPPPNFESNVMESQKPTASLEQVQTIQGQKV